MSFRPLSPRRHLRSCASALVLALCLTTAVAAAPAEPKAIEIPAGALDQALLALAAQTHQQLLYTPDQVAGRNTPGLSGRYTPEEALKRLLANGDLAVTRIDDQTLAVKRKAGAGPFGGGPEAASSGAPVPASTSEPAELETIVVTGSNIRGGQGSSPVIRLDREALARTGQATVAQALQTLPQTFGGETTEATVNTRGDRLGSNAGFGTSVNLRGLGADSTLVLINGRRLAGSGNKGDFADLSSVPAIAVERVEVLLDGASAVYGSDAIAGVVNVILRKDFEGSEVRVRGGIGTRGEPAEGLIGLTTGAKWDGGGLLLSYEAYTRDALPAAARDFAANADLRSFGGSDRRDTLSYPGNILRADPVTGASTPYWGVPTVAGAPRPGDFQAGVINRQNQNLGVDLLPKQRRHSLYLAAHQALTSNLEVSGDLRYGGRRLQAVIQAPTSTFTVTTANPFFVSPIGAASHQIQYSFARDLPNPVIRVATDTLTATAGAGLDLARAWRVEGYLGFAQELTETETGGMLQSLILNEALGGADNPATAYRAATDGYFNPFASRPSNPSSVLAAIGSGFSTSRFRNRVLTANLQADGPLWDMPGGELRLALGAQARREAYRRSGSSYLGTVVPSQQARLSAERDVTALFAEMRAPLVGEANAKPLLRSLELSAAIRAERYEKVGTTYTPKFGAVWSPAEGLKLRATYGESFRAPALQEVGDVEIYTPLRFQDGANRILTLALQGGNPDLDPETAKTWTAGFEWTLPGPLDARLGGGWYRTSFDARIDRPGLSNRAGLLTDPRLAMFVRRIDPRTNPSDLALINALLADPATTTALGVFPASDYSAVVDLRYVNTSRLEVDGVDLQASLAHDFVGGRLGWSLNSALTLGYRQKLTPASPEAELRGTVGAPPKWRHRLTADWSRDQISAGLALNHASGLKDNLGLKVGAQTTVDATLVYRGAPGGRLDGTSFSLSVRNLFDSDPPFYDNPTGFGFEPGSADTIGRFVALQLSRAW